MQGGQQMRAVIDFYLYICQYTTSSSVRKQRRRSLSPRAFDWYDRAAALYYVLSYSSLIQSETSFALFSSSQLIEPGP